MFGLELDRRSETNGWGLNSVVRIQPRKPA
jgi:hypothetical protein